MYNKIPRALAGGVDERHYLVLYCFLCSLKYFKNSIFLALSTFPRWICSEREGQKRQSVRDGCEFNAQRWHLQALSTTAQPKFEQQRNHPQPQVQADRHQ
jgi:hypothetical protein